MFFRKATQRSSAALVRPAEKGSVLVYVILASLALCGMSALVLDFGVLALERHRLLSAADAAALAGAQELVVNPGTDSLAEQLASLYAADNGVAPDRVEARALAGHTMVVEVEGEVPFTFARLLGHDSGLARAEARAVTGAVRSLGGVVPFSIQDQELNFMEEYTLKHSSWKDHGIDPGCFGPLALGGSGKNIYRNNIKHGYGGTIAVGDIVDQEPGNMSGPTEQGIDFRIDEAAGCSCVPGAIEQGCPLLIYVPVVEVYPPGHKQVRVTGFAAFFIDRDNPPGSGNQNEVKGTFIRTIIPGEVEAGSPGYGVLGVNLVY